MPVTATTPAPYAPASGILGLVSRHRSKGLPSPVDAEVLGRAGISQSLTPRTLQALYSLDLLNEDGNPSAVLEGLRLAPESEYQQRMVDWLSAAYADALVFIDPADATEVQIRDAFRSYKPVGQQDRMVSLFIGLFAAAGVRPEKEKQVPRKAASANANGSRAAPKTKMTPARQGPKPQHSGASEGGAGLTPLGLPPAVAGLLASLPAEGKGWSQEQRDKFVTTFGAVLDFCFPIVAVQPGAREGIEDDES